MVTDLTQILAWWNIGYELCYLLDSHSSETLRTLSLFFWYGFKEELSQCQRTKSVVIFGSTCDTNFGAQSNLDPLLTLSPFFVCFFESKYIKINIKKAQANFSVSAYIAPL